MSVPQWTTSCPDWEDRIRAGQSLIPCPVLFPRESDAAMEIFEGLRVFSLPGRPTMKEASRPWVLDFARTVFGSYDPESGQDRLINEFFLLVAKKNTKSYIAAAIMLTALLRNWREGAEYLILAPTLEVARNSFDAIKGMIRADEELSAILYVRDHLKTIEHRILPASLKVVAADSRTVSGKIATGVLVDELWEFGKAPNAENMLIEATGGKFSRPEAFTIYLTTQSDAPPTGVFEKKLRQFRDIRDGKLHMPKSLGVLYEFPKSMIDAGEHKDLRNAYIPNPNLGASVNRAMLEEEFAKAANAGEDSIRGFMAKHLNVEIGASLRADRWAGAEHWEGAAELGLTLDDILDRCEVVTVGIDGGGLDDLLAIAVIGRENGTRRWLHWGHAWAHPIALERRKANITEYERFARDGDLTIISDFPEDLLGVQEIVKKCLDSGLLACVGADQIGISGIVEAMAEIGVTQEKKMLAGISQGYVLSGAVKGVERKLVDGSFVHGGQPIMAWSVSNAKIEPTKNAFLVTKQASGYAKIDPLMALFDAARLMELNPVSKTVEVWAYAC